ncbi:DUF4276 family protein [Polyangium fumosum]|uniref:DUF4276 family protein n=1 Tax=Polyangium fumosum TaxID=889272 RepID=UPI0014792A99|nr:DUF4276 family protein [Polyangium fumosum]
MKVIVYVEGPSDKSALEALLKPIIEEGRRNGRGISFSPQGGKAQILNDVPRKAAEHLKQHPQDWVFVLPDLYPMAYYDGGPNEHRSFPALRQLLQDKFKRWADKFGLSVETLDHFRVHCLKHDLEALLLAAPDALRARLKTKDKLHGHWRMPVEDQNDNKPPKRVVEALFEKYREKPKYIDTIDAVWILGRAVFSDVESACPQNFAPLVRELRSIAADGALP